MYPCLAINREVLINYNALEAFKQAPISKAANSLKDTDLT